MNSVKYILENRPLSFEDKIHIKKLGRPTPDLVIKLSVKCKAREFDRNFKQETLYDRFLWLCGCSDTNKFYCFICLLSNDIKPSPWIKDGVDNFLHLSERAAKHADSVTHLNNWMDFNISTTVDIRNQLDTAYVTSIRMHNEKVDKNRHILCRLIMCIKLCGAFGLALNDQDERVDSQNSEVFQGLVDFTSELDSALNIHLAEATIFNGTSKIIQNELLDAMLDVCKGEIKDQIAKARFLAMEVDEATDSFNQQQLVISFRYVLDGKIFERFWGFICPEQRSAENIYKAILKELVTLEIPADKLIAQSYDGASVMYSSTGNVQDLLKQNYPYAYFIHCYAHQFNLILEKAASCRKKLKIFFGDVQSCTMFFSQSAKRTAVLKEIVKKRLPGAVPTEWNFKSTINLIYENKDMLLECLDKIVESSNDGKTLAQATGLQRNLNSVDFNFFLEALYHIIPQVEMFLDQVRPGCAGNAHIHKWMNNFETDIHEIQNNIVGASVDSVFEEVDNDNKQSSKRQRIELPECNSKILKEYCNILIQQIKDRYQFTGHLAAASLFFPDMYNSYQQTFPQEIFDQTLIAYPFLNSAKLISELRVIYTRNDMCGSGNCNGILSLFLFITRNNLTECFSETHKILEIICTTPMTTCECERCFSTLKRIKCFLKNAVTQDRLEALAMLSLEKKLVHDISDFDKKVVEVFADKQNRGTDFKYK